MFIQNSLVRVSIAAFVMAAHQVTASTRIVASASSTDPVNQQDFDTSNSLTRRPLPTQPLPSGIPRRLQQNITTGNGESPRTNDSDGVSSLTTMLIMAACAMVLAAVIGVVYFRRARRHEQLSPRKNLASAQQASGLQQAQPDKTKPHDDPHWINPMLSANSIYDYNNSCSPANCPQDLGDKASHQANTMHKQRNVTSTPVVAMLHSQRAEDRDSFASMSVSTAGTEFYKSIGTPSKRKTLRSKHYQAQTSPTQVQTPPIQVQTPPTQAQVHSQEQPQTPVRSSVVSEISLDPEQSKSSAQGEQLESPIIVEVFRERI